MDLKDCGHPEKELPWQVGLGLLGFLWLPSRQESVAKKLLLHRACGAIAFWPHRPWVSEEASCPRPRRCGAKSRSTSASYRPPNQRLESSAGREDTAGEQKRINVRAVLLRALVRAPCALPFSVDCSLSSVSEASSTELELVETVVVLGAPPWQSHWRPACP